MSICHYRRRKERRVLVVKEIHCDSHVNTTDEEHKKAIIDGLWTTFIKSATNEEVREYVSKSKKIHE